MERRLAAATKPVALYLCGGALATLACANEGAHKTAVDAGEGARLYQQNCSTCHGEDGRGRPPVYPPLAGHVPRLLAAPGGRAYFVRVPLFGLAGPIEAEGERYAGLMAPFDFRKDPELAAILNHVLNAWGNARLLRQEEKPIMPEEIGKARKSVLTPKGVYESRPRVGGS